MATSNQIQETDKFGTVRFAAIKAEVDKYELSKDDKRRLEKVVSVFSYRTGVAHELENVSHYDYRLRRTTEDRLSRFKPIQFFLDAIQTLLDDVKKGSIAAEALKEAKRKQRRQYSSW